MQVVLPDAKYRKTTSDKNEKLSTSGIISELIHTHYVI
jgi:hypothetical protein